MTEERDRFDRLIDALERLADAHTADRGDQGTAPQTHAPLTHEELEARARIKLKNSYDLALEYHRDANFFAQSSIRMALIFNGGGILVVMNFIAALIRSNQEIAEQSVSDLSTALIVFVIGAALAIVASSFSYFGNVWGTRRRAIEAGTVVLSEVEKGFREISLGTKKSYAKLRDSNLVLATTSRVIVVISMLTAYALFAVGAYLSNTALIEILRA